MDKTEVSMFLTAISGRRLCEDMRDFHKWAEKRLSRKLPLKLGRYLYSTHSLTKELTDTITDTEWAEIADFFIGSKTEDSEVK